MGKKSRQKKIKLTSSATEPEVRTVESRGIIAAAIILIMLIAAGVYANTLFNGFVYDDESQVLENPWIRDARFIPYMFTSSVWSFLEPKMGTSNYYRPMMHLIYLFNYRIFGLKPWGFHLVNIILHVLVSVMVFLMAKALLRQAGQAAPSHAARSSVMTSILPAFVVALLFATHPIHTEAVSWIASVPELSYTLFFILSFYSYVKSAEGAKGMYALSVAAFGIATLCKEPALMLPFVLMAYDFVLRRLPASFSGTPGSSAVFIIKRYIPYFLISGVYIGVRTSALKGFSPANVNLKLTAYEYVINIFPVFAGHLKGLLLPVNLNAYHVLHPISSLLALKGIVSIIVISCLVLLGFWGSKKDRLFLFSLLMIAVPLLPSLYIPAIGVAALAERYLYLPSFGFVLLFGLAIARMRTRPHLILAILFVAALTAAYSVGVIGRNAIWRDDIMLFADTTKKSPDGMEPHLGLAYAYTKLDHMDDAIKELKVAVELEPDSIEAHANLGAAYARKNLLEEAVAELKAALTLNPNIARVHGELGGVYVMQNKLKEAVAELKTALNLNPNIVRAHSDLGTAYAMQNKPDEAIAEFKAALNLDPSFAIAHCNLGLAYMNERRPQDAIAEYKTAVSLKPDYDEAHYNLGLAYVSEDRLDMAVDEFNAVLRLKPDNAKARQALEILNKRIMAKTNR